MIYWGLESINKIKQQKKEKKSFDGGVTEIFHL